MSISPQNIPAEVGARSVTAIPPSFPPSDVPAQPLPEAGGQTPDFFQLGKNYKLAADGADKHMRFRYQATCAAIFALDMLDAESKYEVLYCEALEDFSIKKKNGQFTAVQVKSRTKGCDPLKTNDDEVVSSLRRFCGYEETRGSSFSRYIIATNIGFWRRNNDWHDLTFLTSHTRTLTTEEALLADNIFTKAHEVVKDGQNGITEALLKSIFSKLELKDDLPHTTEAKLVLKEVLRKYCNMEGVLFEDFDEVVKDVVDFFCELGSRGREDNFSATIVLADDPATARGEMRLASRTVTTSGLQDRIEKALNKARVWGQVRQSVERTFTPRKSTVSFTSLTSGDVEERIRQSMDNIRRFREQFEWDRSANALGEILEYADVNFALVSAGVAFDLYTLAADVEAEGANRSSGVERERHIGKAKSYLKKAEGFRDS